MLKLTQIILRLIISLFFGLVIGFFLRKRKVLDFKIYPLFSLTATALTIFSLESFFRIFSKSELMILPASLLIGLFFISQSLIKESGKFEELMNIGYLSFTAIVGFMIGFGFYKLAIFTTLIILIFTLFSPFLENFYKK